MMETKVQNPPGPLRTERLSNGNRILIRDLVVKLDDATEIKVPKGFETNFSSIPSWARPFLHWSRVDVAGVVHDFLYWCPQANISKERADDIWRELAGAGDHHANGFLQWSGRIGLRVWGWRAHRRARIAREEGRGRKCEIDSVVMTKSDLVECLREVYHHAEQQGLGVTAVVCLFGIRYAEAIRNCGEAPGRLCELANIPSHGPMINLGMSLSQYVSVRE